MTVHQNRQLQERLIQFSQKIILLTTKFPKSLANMRLIPQVVGSSDSMCANYGEACEAESSLDFIHKIRIVKKESQETRIHLRLLYTSNPQFKSEIVELGKESLEYIKIFSTIDRNYRTSRVPAKSK